MTKKGKIASGARRPGKLKLRRKTLSDLGAREKAGKVKGGAVPTPPGPVPIPYPNTAGCSEVATCACVTGVTCLACVRR